VLGLHQVATLLQTTLDEENDEDRELSSLAGLINSRAESPNWTLSIVS
jgi:ferritin-like metal-binding protein YciE